ncbi:DoxX family protein [Cellulophaga sp. L1A9]|uniref:DoxX family protein n=1 Tax=Cellulophaga sp. L1A9 TaxID=2686362 RepID=UPI00131BEA7C|nr:DoxX family protein [Cellulophaga sp. L1A9]
MNVIKENILNAITVIIMSFFAIPKLTGMPRSIEGFKQFEIALGIPATFFRIFTGISELALAGLLIFAFVYEKQKIEKIAFAFLLVTMLTAILLELLARPEPKLILVAIAIFLAIGAIYKLNKNSITTEHDT